MNPTLFSEKDLPQNYWFVRTESGKYYREFIENEFIAINWNDFVDLDEICSLRLRTLKDKVKEHYEEEKRPGVAAAQMQTFVGTMKKSDIVLIPNARSREIAHLGSLRLMLMSYPYAILRKDNALLKSAEM